MEKIFNESLDASIELAVGLKDVLAITEELGRTYADLDEVQLRAAASNAVLLASVTDMTSDTAVSGLIAITQAYNIAIEDSISVVDALNVVNNNYAIGAADLSRSLERSAAAAAEVGVSFENLIGYTTAVKTSTRESGSVIGNSLKTIVIGVVVGILTFGYTVLFGDGSLEYLHVTTFEGLYLNRAPRKR